MKGATRLIARYACAAAGIVALFLVINGLTFVQWLGSSYAQGARGLPVSVRELSGTLERKGDEWRLSARGAEILDNARAWCMLLDEDGRVSWSRGLPPELPLRYTAGEVASFSRWYLKDYPVYVWNREDGHLLVAGLPKGSVWKHDMQMPESVMKHLPAWLLGVLALNVLVALGVALLMGRRLFRALKPAVEGIERLARGEQVHLKASGILSDINRSVNVVSEALARRDDARARWIRAVSHDIRTPLSLVNGYAAALSEEQSLPEQARKKSRIILRQGEKLRDLVSDLNLVNRLEYDMRPLERTPVNLVAVARSAVADALNSGWDEAHAIALETAPGTRGLRVAGDERLLGRALSNLLGNSARHNPSGCAITLKVRAQGDDCILSVEDDGKGYPEAALSSSGGEGGLGLSIVRQIAKAHGGALALENRREGGCIAQIRLPRYGRRSS